MHDFSYSYMKQCTQECKEYGSWEILRLGDETEEIRIYGNGRTFEVVLGYSDIACFLCMPDYDVGCSLEVANILSLTDHLEKALEHKDARLIVYALSDYLGEPVQHDSKWRDATGL